MAAAAGVWCLYFWLRDKMLIAMTLGGVAVFCHDIALALPYVALIYRPKRWYWGPLTIKVLSIIAAAVSFSVYRKEASYAGSFDPRTIIESAAVTWAGLVWPGGEGGPFLVGLLVIAAVSSVVFWSKGNRVWAMFAALSPMPTLFVADHARTYYLALAIPILAILAARLMGQRLIYVAIAVAVVGSLYDQHALTTRSSRWTRNAAIADAIDVGHIPARYNSETWYVFGWGYADSVRQKGAK